MRLLPFLALLFPLLSLSAAYSPVPRWGQAIAVVNDALFVFGGKTDPYNTYGYTSAPWNNDLLFLPLSTTFDPSAPPWQYISGSQNASTSSQGIAVAWHTLSAFNASFFLIFGGDTGPLSSVVVLDNSDSAQLLGVHDHTAPTFLTFPNNWAGQPQRRMRHASASANGKIYIIGGEAADGSGNTFSTHYIFDPSIPAFIQLPTQNSPPGIYGHTVIILPDGRLFVFGGVARGQLVPFSTIWILDTTKPNSTWTLATVNGVNLPPPRAAFAVVLLDDGRILIQGGSDSTFQTNLADGWILDPSKNPMTWTAVPALSRVGPRRDHFGFNAGGQVIFGFGYGNSAPADPAVQVYNVDSSSFQPTFSPMTAAPSRTTLPPDTSHPITNPSGSSQTRTSGSPSGPSSPGRSGPSGSTSSKPGKPTSPSPSGGGGRETPMGGSEKNKAGIIVGIVLGVLGFATGVAIVLWYLRRRHARSGHAFDPLGDDEEDSPHSITAVRIGGTRETGPRILAVPLGLLGMIGLGPSRRHLNRSRRDILADEDRSFQWVSVSREGSGGRSSFGSRSARNSIRGLSNVITEGFASIRNLTRGAGSSPRSQEPSANWEKMGGDPFSPEVALMAEGLSRDQLPERSRDGSGPSQPYTDPFADRDTSSDVLPLYDPAEPEAEPSHASEKRKHPPTETKSLTIRTAMPPSADFVPLSPLVEQASQNSLTNSSSSHRTKSGTNSDQYAGSGSSQEATRSPRPSSILDPNPPLSQPIRRSNSWWSRFAKTPLLERRGTESSSRNGGFIDFRDPNPPPRLLTIEESNHSRSPSVGTAEGTSRLKPPLGANRARAGTPTRRPSLYHDTIHGRSASSLQTANTDMLDRLGGTMDIVQRDGTLDSQHMALAGLDDEFGIGGGGSGSGSGPLLRALLVRGEPSYHSTRTASSSVSASIESPVIQSPLRSAAVSPSEESAHYSTHPSIPSPPPPTEEVGAGSVAEHAGSPPRSPGVADRVRTLERRMSRETAPPPLPTNTRQREERLTPPPAALAAAARPAVRYGLVPRPSLFVANPDRSGGGSRGGSDGG